MLQTFKNGQGSIVLRVKLLDSTATTGAGKTGLSSSSSGLIISTIADNEATATVYAQASSNVESITTLGTFAAPTSGKCRFKEVDSTNHKGIYEIQIADARFAVASAKSLLVSISGVTGLAEADFVVQLQSDDPFVAKPTNYASLSIDGNGRVDVIKVAGTSQTAGDIIGDTNDIQARLPAALVSGRMDSSVGAMANNVLTAAAINADAITDAKVASDVTIASVTGAVGSVTGNVGGNVAGSVGSVAAAGIAASSFAAGAIDAAAIATDALGALELAAGAASEIATAVRTELATELGRVDVAVSTRLATAGYTTPPTAGAIADQVWEETLADHSGTSGSTAAALNSAGSAGDPWSTAVPGAYGAGTAGKILGDNLNATVSSRLPTSSYTAPLDAAGTRTAVGLASANLDTQLDALPTNAELATALGTADDAVLAQVALVKAKTDLIPSDPADASDIASSFSTVNATLTTIAGYIDTEVATLVSRLGTPTGASIAADIAAVLAKWTTAMTESYAAQGATMTPVQALHMIVALLSNRDIVGTTLTTRKLDGTTAAATFDLDSGTAPTSQVRAT